MLASKVASSAADPASLPQTSLALGSVCGCSVGLSLIAAHPGRVSTRTRLLARGGASMGGAPAGWPEASLACARVRGSTMPLVPIGCCGRTEAGLRAGGRGSGRATRRRPEKLQDVADLYWPREGLHSQTDTRAGRGTGQSGLRQSLPDPGLDSCPVPGSRGPWSKIRDGKLDSCPASLPCRRLLRGLGLAPLFAVQAMQFG